MHLKLVLFSLSLILLYRTALMEGRGSLEEQLEAVKRKAGDITAKKETLKTVEELGAKIEEALIFDNKYSYFN